MTLKNERFGAEVKSPPLNFKEIAKTALLSARSLLPRWLPGGRWENDEYVAKNPTRADAHAGSFKINARSGVWSDFATGDAGRDLLDLKAFLDGESLAEAALKLAQELGIFRRGGSALRLTRRRNIFPSRSCARLALRPFKTPTGQISRRSPFPTSAPMAVSCASAIGWPATGALS